MNRRTFLKRSITTLLGILGVSGGTYYYAKEVEPYMLHVQEEIISSAAIPKSFDNFKVVQFSDTHIGFHYSLEDMKNLINKINNQHPDIIVFTGDLIDDPFHYEWNHTLIKELQLLEAPYGKYWIYGNHDHGGYGTNILKKTMKKSGFQLLKNEHTVIDINHDRIILAGVDDAILGQPNLDTALANVNTDLFTILLAHEPDFADKAVHYPIDVQLSGHSHGGQVRLPLIGHLYTPAFAEKYIEGKYTFNDTSFTLYVNKGIGTTRLPYRFLCAPEIHTFTLQHSS